MNVQVQQNLDHEHLPVLPEQNDHQSLNVREEALEELEDYLEGLNIRI
jgi:hypothetical protein